MTNAWTMVRSFDRTTSRNDRFVAMRRREELRNNTDAGFPFDEGMEKSCAYRRRTVGVGSWIHRKGRGEYSRNERLFVARSVRYWNQRAENKSCAATLTLKRVGVRKRRGTKRTDLKTEQRAWNCARSCLYATASVRFYTFPFVSISTYLPYVPLEFVHSE